MSPHGFLRPTQADLNHAKSAVALADKLAQEMQTAARMSPRKCRRHIRRILRREFAGSVIS